MLVAGKLLLEQRPLLGIRPFGFRALVYRQPWKHECLAYCVGIRAEYKEGSRLGRSVPWRGFGIPSGKGTELTRTRAIIFVVTWGHKMTAPFQDPLIIRSAESG